MGWESATESDKPISPPTFEPAAFTPMLRITKTGALKVSLVGIVTVIIAEGLGGMFTGSLALLSDSAHASFDALSTLILLLATRLSLKPADEDHTYGHGKFESLGALIGGIVLLLLAIGIVAEAALRLGAGSIVHPTIVGYGAAGYTMAIDVMRLVVLTSALKTGSLSVRADLYHAISDLFSTALVFVALGLASLGYVVGDTAVSLVLAVLLGYLSVRLIHSSVLDLSDAISGKLVQSIFREIRKTEEVLKIKELRVRRVGQVTYVDAVIAVSPFAGITDADSIATKIENSLTKLLGKSSILIHLEPLEWDIPLELKIRRATGQVQGARGLHNLSVTRINSGLYVTLHVQVDPTLSLEKAHGIAESVENGIHESVPEVRQVTVHLEPSMAETSSGTLVDDKSVAERIRAVVQTHPDVIQVSGIMIYKADEKLHINVHCLFAAGTPIGEIHGIISRIEDSVRQEVKDAIVTIHPEPTVRQDLERAA
jgi:cation diffusion facilitator family transporter